jgi:voltage-gated potassium channel
VPGIDHREGLGAEPMNSTHSLARYYVQHRFAVLFAVLLTAIAGHGFVGLVVPLANPLDWLLGISLVAVVFSARGARLRWLLAGLAVVCVAVRLTQGFLEHPAPPLVSQSLVGVLCAMAAGVATRRAFVSGAVDSERICAALAAYLLTGIAFGVGYWLMETALPGSFSSSSTEPFTPARAIYFSFVTQATLGFGDMVPIRAHSEGVVVAQGLGGQMYLAVLIARLVTLYSAGEKT